MQLQVKLMEDKLAQLIFNKRNLSIYKKRCGHRAFNPIKITTFKLCANNSNRDALNDDPSHPGMPLQQQ
jgi:hypothetical protein